MNAYEIFEYARQAFEDYEDAHGNSDPAMIAYYAVAYMDAAIAAQKDGYVFTDQVHFVWRRVKEYL